MAFFAFDVTMEQRRAKCGRGNPNYRHGRTTRKRLALQGLAKEVLTLMSTLGAIVDKLAAGSDQRRRIQRLLWTAPTRRHQFMIQSDGRIYIPAKHLGNVTHWLQAAARSLKCIEEVVARSWALPNVCGRAVRSLRSWWQKCCARRRRYRHDDRSLSGNHPHEEADRKGEERDEDDQRRREHSTGPPDPGTP